MDSFWNQTNWFIFNHWRKKTAWWNALANSSITVWTAVNIATCIKRDRDTGRLRRCLSGWSACCVSVESRLRIASPYIKILARLQVSITAAWWAETGGSLEFVGQSSQSLSSSSEIPIFLKVLRCKSIEKNIRSQLLASIHVHRACAPTKPICTYMQHTQGRGTEKK